MTYSWCRHHDVLLTLWGMFYRHEKLFDIMTNFFTSWRTLWCYDVLFDAMIYFGCHYRLFDVMAYFWRHYVNMTSWRTCWRHEELSFFEVIMNFLVSWCICDVPLTPWHIYRHHDELFNIMTNFLTLWQTLWRHDESLFSSLRTFLCYDVLFDVLMYCWCHDRLFDVMTYFWRRDVTMTSWRTCWCHDELFWHHDELFSVITYF